MRRLFLLLLVSMLPLGCGEDPVIKESREARTEFEKVVGMVKEVQEGYLRTEKGLAALGSHKPTLVSYEDPKIKEAIKSGQIRDYRLAVIEQTEAKLKALLGKGQASQRVAAHQLLSSLYLASAAHHRRDAMIVSDALSSQASSIETFLSSIETNSGLIGVFTDDEKPVLDKWSQNQEAVSAAVSKFQGEATTLEAEVADLQKEIDALATKRDEAFKQASALRAQAFSKKGQEEYELHIKAIDAEKEGQSADIKIDELTLKQDLAKAKLTLVQRELGIAQKWGELLKGGVDDVTKRQEAMAALESEIVRYRTEASTNLSGELRQLTEDYEQKVTAKLDVAIAKAKEAVETLKKADGLAKGDEKASVKFDLLDAQLAKLAAEADALVATNRFVTVGSQVRSRTGQAFAGDAAALSTQVDQARTRQSSLAEESRKTVAEINTLLSDSVIAGIKEGTDLGDARVARIKSARTIAGNHASRLSVYDGAAPPPAPETPAPETPAAPDAAAPDAAAPDAGN